MKVVRRGRASFRPGVLAAAVVVVVLAAAAAGSAGGAADKSSRTAADAIVFESTQLTPVDEQQSFLNVVLKGFNNPVTFLPATSVNDMVNQLDADQAAGKGKVGVAGATVGDMASVKDDLLDLSDIAANFKQTSTIPQSLWDQAKLGTNQQLTIPWMQATYVMAANKKALPYLPKGANINALTWGQFAIWAKNLDDQFHGPQVGFPAGPTGLWPRFLEGYLVPSFSGHLVTTFQSSGAVAGWLYLKNLWRHVNPQSTTYNFMQDPLLSGEALVAWDHVARLNAALTQKPDDFVIFPAPAGPKGRGFLPVLATIGVPKTAPDPAGAKALIQYLVGVSQQAKTISTEGFFPVVGQRLSKRINAGLLKIAAGVKAQQTSEDALPSVLPIGLGNQAGAYAKVFTDTFTRLVLNGESNPQQVLQQEGQALQSALTAAGAKCWQPDPASTGVCQVG